MSLSPLLCTAQAASLLPLCPAGHSAFFFPMFSLPPKSCQAVQLFLKPIRVTNLHMYNKVIPQDNPPYWGSCLLYLSETPEAMDLDCVLRHLLGPGMSVYEMFCLVSILLLLVSAINSVNQESWCAVLGNFIMP